MDASVLASLGGFFIGTYPIFVKSRAVLATNVHPAVFQLYKSFWVALTGILCVGLRWARGDEPTYAFTWWAVLAAFAWVPAGACLVAAVPLAGVGAGVLIFDGSTTLISFFVALLAFHEPMRPHAASDGSVYYLAPLYLVTALSGMAGLVLLPKWVASITSTTASTGSEMASSSATTARHTDAAVDTRTEPLLGGADHHGAYDASRRGIAAKPSGLLSAPPVTGVALAVAAGTLSATQYAIVTVAKQHADASAPGKQALDPLGSWTLTFGVTSLLINSIGVGLLGAFSSSPTTTTATSTSSVGGGGGGPADAAVADAEEAVPAGRAPSRPVHALRLRELWLPASAAGVCYSASVLCTTLAVERGGNAVILTQRNAVSLLTSGLWGLLYYREVRGYAALAWVAAAALTTASVVLLGLEKGAA